MEPDARLKAFYALYVRAGMDVRAIPPRKLRELELTDEGAFALLSEPTFPWNELEDYLATSKARLRDPDVDEMPDDDFNNAGESMRDEELGRFCREQPEEYDRMVESTRRRHKDLLARVEEFRPQPRQGPQFQTPQ